MDGGDRQARMAQRIKIQIRASSTQNHRITQGIQIGVFSSDERHGHPPQNLQLLDAAIEPSPILNQADDISSVSKSDDTEQFLESLYLDTVFPFLFPAYKPTLLSGGRSWLPGLLKSNKAFFHSAMGVAAHYFTLILARDAGHTIRTPCEQHVWDSLAKHINLSTVYIKQDIAVFNSGSPGDGVDDIFRKLAALQSISGMLIFETVMSKGTDWQVHLNAALTILGDIFQYEMTPSETRYSLNKVLVGFQNQPSFFDGIELGFPVWNTDQASFRFFSAFLFYTDILTGVSFGETPQLRHLHKDLINKTSKRDPDTNQDPQFLDLEQYIGCPGWILLCISEISMWERRLEQSVGHENHFGALNEWAVRLEELNQNFLHQFLDSGSPHNSDIGNRATAKIQLITRVWMHAAQIYLSVMDSSWHQLFTVAASNVESVLTIIKSLEPQKWLRSIIWPVLISGCAAGSEVQREYFREFIVSLGPFQRFGTFGEALHLMERVWRLHDQGAYISRLEDIFIIDRRRYLII
ncbi:hypothetical protein TWF694_002185 [Orbilia ellipsospora]|uniref:C6 transcription factor n=1 Tax=Orbilia ellipsospora TaxID=2528407 RepID=A0AAV9X4S4_9PEZI